MARDDLDDLDDVDASVGDLADPVNRSIDEFNAHAINSKRSKRAQTVDDQQNARMQTRDLDTWRGNKDRVDFEDVDDRMEFPGIEELD